MGTSEKFGKVFLQFRSGNEKDAPIDFYWEEIPFVCFSNSDLTWYRADGGVHEQFRNYLDHSFSLGLKMSKEITPGVKETFDVRLYTGCRLGDISRSHGVSASNRHHNEKMPFTIDNPVIDKLVQLEHLDILSDFILPPSISGSHGDKKLLYYVLPCVLCDSLKNKEIVQKMKLSYKQLSMVTDEILHYLKSGSNDGGNNGGGKSYILKIITPSALRNVKLSQVRLLQQSYQLTGQLANGIREEAVELCGGDENLIQPFIQSITSTFQQGCLENSLEFRETNFPQRSEFPGEIKYTTRGFQVILEAVALETGIFLEESVRETFVFQRFIHHFVLQMGRIHDIFDEDSTTWRNTDLDMITALVQDANDSMKEFLSISDLLIKLYDDKNGLENSNKGNISGFIRLAKQIICGFIQWQVYRYPSLVFDCYVAEKYE